MYKAIREVDRDHIIIFEACWGITDLPNPKDYGWENIMYQYHPYTFDYRDDNDESFNGLLDKKIILIGLLVKFLKSVMEFLLILESLFVLIVLRDGIMF